MDAKLRPLNLGDLIMKHRIVQTLKKIQDGSISGFGTIVGFVIMLVFVLAFLAIIPQLLVWGLALLGFPIEQGFSSFLGACFITAYILIIRAAGGSRKDK